MARPAAGRWGVRRDALEVAYASAAMTPRSRRTFRAIASGMAIDHLSSSIAVLNALSRAMLRTACGLPGTCLRGSGRAISRGRSRSTGRTGVHIAAAASSGRPSGPRAGAWDVLRSRVLGWWRVDERVGRRHHRERPRTAVGAPASGQRGAPQTSACQGQGPRRAHDPRQAAHARRHAPQALEAFQAHEATRAQEAREAARLGAARGTRPARHPVQPAAALQPPRARAERADHARPGTRLLWRAGFGPTPGQAEALVGAADRTGRLRADAAGRRRPS